MHTFRVFILVRSLLKVPQIQAQYIIYKNISHKWLAGYRVQTVLLLVSFHVNKAEIYASANGGATKIQIFTQIG